MLAITVLLSNAQSAYLIKDIYSGTNSNSLQSIRNLINVNNTLFFTATDGTHGRELWKSDGTTVGTVMVKDIYAGSTDASIDYLTNVNGTLFFAATDGINGVELWKSDGTEEGTVMVKDISNGSLSSTPAEFCNIDGTLYFRASDGINGHELWKSDGTALGTVMVKDIVGFYTGTGSSLPDRLTNINGTLFFSADNGTLGRELWKSDGTATGTVMVKDIYVGGNTSHSNLSNFTNVSGILYFSAYDNVYGQELWKSDGTAAGTVRVKDIYPDANGSIPTYLTGLNGTLYFAATDPVNGQELWKSDGTETTIVKDIIAGSSSSSLKYLIDLNGTLLFTATHATYGNELWKSDGTEVGTVMLKDIIAGSSTPINLIVVNSILYFATNEYANGKNLWKSNGTAAGTVLVKNIFASSNTIQSDFININGTLFFSAGDATELWAVTIDDIPLPVSLTNFNASLKTNGAQLTWSTESELNNNHFVIEKSLDGIVFQTLTTINGKGTSTTTSSYQFIDVNFAQSAYYRLTQVDANGTKTVYHDLVRFVKSFTEQESISIYPNPAKEKLFVSLPAAKANSAVKLLNLHGKVIQTKIANGQTLTFDVQHLPSGIYLVQHTDGKQVHVSKVVKQ